MENQPTFEFHLYLKLSPRIATILFDLFVHNWNAEKGSYFMEVEEDQTGSFEKASENNKVS